MQADRTLVAEQRKTDFRPPEDGEPPPLDRPTDACTLVAALLSALLRLAAQHLQASNLASFDMEVRDIFLLVPQGCHSACACQMTLHMPWLRRRPLHASQTGLCLWLHMRAALLQWVHEQWPQCHRNPVWVLSTDSRLSAAVNSYCPAAVPECWQSCSHARWHVLCRWGEGRMPCCLHTCSASPTVPPVRCGGSAMSQSMQRSSGTRTLPQPMPRQALCSCSCH